MRYTATYSVEFYFPLARVESTSNKTLRNEKILEIL